MVDATKLQRIYMDEEIRAEEAKRDEFVKEFEPAHYQMR